jgi:hypothetical protein
MMASIPHGSSFSGRNNTARDINQFGFVGRDVNIGKYNEPVVLFLVRAW